MKNLSHVLIDKFKISQPIVDEIYKYLLLKTYVKGEHYLELANRPTGLGYVEHGGFMYYTVHDGVEKAIDFSFEDSLLTDMPCLVIS